MKVHIITWAFFDKSAHGVVGAWANLSDANAAMSLLEQHGDMGKKFEVQCIELVAAQAAQGEMG